MLSGCIVVRLLILLLVLCISFKNFSFAQTYVNVGFGEHKSLGNKIYGMGTNKKIATAENLKEYKAKDNINICDVVIEGNDIVLNYKRGSKISTDGCAVDMLTLKSWNDHFVFDAILKHKRELKDCFKEGDGAFSENLVPFAYSIETEVFLKNSKTPPLYPGIQCDSSCKEKCSFCNNCLKDPALEIAWSRSGERDVIVHVQPNIEPQTKKCPAGGTIRSSDSKAKFRFEIANPDGPFWIQVKQMRGELNCTNDELKYLKSNKFSCMNKDQIVRPKSWEIVDKNFKTNGDYKYLFSFYFLPQSAARNRWENGTIRGNDHKPNGPNCDVEFRFNKKDFQLLINGEQDSGNVVTKPPLGPKPPESSNKTEPTTKETTPTTTIKPKEEGSNLKWVIIAVVVGVLLLILAIAGIGFVVIISKGEKDEDGGETAADTKVKKGEGKAKKPDGKGKSGAKERKEIVKVLCR
ncbi:hypothetical protein Mgra_00000036, partial [Meloidogyne graminicola]